MPKGPINFLQGTPMQNPTAQLLQQFGGALQQRKARGLLEKKQALMAQQQAQAVKERERQDQLVSELQDMEDPTFDDYNKVALELPKDRSKRLIDGFNQKSSIQQNNQLKQNVEIMAALDFSSEAGVNILNERAQLERESGDEPEALQLERLAKAAETDPDKVRTFFGTMTAALPGGKDFLDNLSNLKGGGRGKDSDLRFFAPVTLVNKAGEKKIVLPTGDPQTGEARLSEADIPEGFEISRETAEEKRQAEIVTVGKKKGAEITGKAIAGRRQESIDSGLEASTQLANLKRARTLLETVKTGGVNAVSIRAKQLFGVEGANEAELSNKLSQAVLKLLKPTFGAAFTVEESNKLERIAAGFGKSPDANKRILEQLIKEIEKKANEGIDSAKGSGDLDAAKRIQNNMKFTLDVEPTTAPKTKTIGRFQVEVE